MERSANIDAEGPRYLFFTNECVGLGHLRRALSLARAVTTADATATALIVTGSPLAADYVLPERVDVVTLPALARDADGAHRARRLAVPRADVQQIRAAIALAAAETFVPDVAIVDKTPLGLRGELVPALDHLRSVGTPIVLGLRDIEDSPAAVERNWAGLRDEIEARYDAALVYGPESSPHAIACLGWDVPFPVHHVGYVSHAPERVPPDDLAPGYVVVTVGGGADGADLIERYLEAIRLAPVDRRSLVVTGPLMPEDDLRRLRLAAAGTDADVVTFRGDMEAVVAGADAVVAMAGYNTVAEIVAAGVPAVIVPRVRPSEEQLVRATRLAEAGIADVIHPDELTPARLRMAVGAALERGRRPGRPGSDGASRAADVLQALAAAAVEVVA